MVEFAGFRRIKCSMVLALIFLPPTFIVAYSLYFGYCRILIGTYE